MKDLVVTDVEEGGEITQPETTKECGMCREKVVCRPFMESVLAPITGKCRCGVWTFDIANTRAPITFKARHPWGMTSVGVSIGDAIARIVL